MARAFMLLAALLASAGPLLAGISDSVVRIEATSQEPDYRLPWNPGDVSRGTGSGFVIDGDRIMTNAHVVSNARFLRVFKEGDPKPYEARVLHIAHDCDLALLAVDNIEFFNGTTALALDGIPAIESVVSVYGYPIGGTRLSVTRGIVSRIDFLTYSHSGMDSHLTIQIDAAINPGNSGGPVMQSGRVVGVAFQGYSGDVAQNVGYMIPAPVVERFLADVEDGSYDRYMDLAISYHNLFNPAARAALGLPDEDSGVMVGDVYSGGSSDTILKPGDVLLSIDDFPILSDGMIPFERARVPLTEVVERKFKGEKTTLRVIRDRKSRTITIPLDEPWPFTLQARTYDQLPRFVVFGGLVFQPVDRNLMDTYNPSDLRLNYLYEHYIEDAIHRDHPELVTLANILPDPVNAYADEFRFSVVESINGKKIQRLDDVAAAFDQPTDYHVIKMLGNGRPLVLEHTAVDAARPRILERYGITTERRLSP
jgi:S1-C subfamily serine protease